jgi:hypothetical protein
MNDLRRIRDEAWQFFAAPTNGASAALFRLLYGTLAVWTAIGVGLNLRRYYGADGMIPWDVVAGWKWASFSLFAIDPDSELILSLHFWAFLVAAVLFLVGFAARPAAFVIYAVNVSLEHRNPFIINSGDRLFLILAFYAMFMPLTHRWSLSSLWRKWRSLPPLPPMPVWGLRLVALQISYVYLSTAFSKLRHVRWLEGRALRDVLASPLYAEWPTHVDFWPIIYALTWGTIVFELLFPVLAWFRKYRPVMIASGVMFHTGIDLLMTIPMFSAVMMVTYACYLSDDETERLVRRIRSPFGAVRSAVESAKAPEPEEKRKKKRKRRPLAPQST